MATLTTSIISSEEFFYTAALYREGSIYPEIIPSGEEFFLPTIKTDREIDLYSIRSLYIQQEDFSSVFSEYPVTSSPITYSFLAPFEVNNLIAVNLISVFSELSPRGDLSLEISINGGDVVTFVSEPRSPFYFINEQTIGNLSTENGDIIITESGSPLNIVNPVTWNTGDSISISLISSQTSDYENLTVDVFEDVGIGTLTLGVDVYSNVNVPWEFQEYDDTYFSGEFFYTAGAPVSTFSIPSEEFTYAPDVVIEEYFATVDSFIDDFELYKPSVNKGPVFIEPLFIDVDSFDDITHVIETTIDVTTTVFNEPFVFQRTYIVQETDDPLLLKQLPSFGSTTLTDRIAPKLRYYFLEENEVLDGSQIEFTNANDIIQNYIRGDDSLSGETFYSAFYIHNTSDVTERKNIQLWLDGGTAFEVSNDTGKAVFEENQLFFSKERTNILNRFGIDTDTLRDQYEFVGSARSSVFDQVKVSVYIAEKNQFITPPDQFNISQLFFEDMVSKVKVPDLKKGEFVGVYLKFEIEFNASLNIPFDYSFLHLSYQNSEREQLEQYPGQTYFISGNEYVPQTLPSIRFEFITNYQRFLELIDSTTDELYDRYPPFFLDYRDYE